MECTQPSKRKEIHPVTDEQRKDHFFLPTEIRIANICIALGKALAENNGRERQFSTLDPSGADPICPTLPSESLPKPIRDEVGRICARYKVHPIVALVAALDAPETLTRLHTVVIDGWEEQIEGAQIASVLTLLCENDIWLEEAEYMTYGSITKFGVLFHAVEGLKTDGIGPETISRVMRLTRFFIDFVAFVDAGGSLKAAS
jgi:hypothetical protein